MPEQSLYELIHQFRGWLAKKGDCGKLISERILLSSGELVGMQFCCETAAIQWEFASSQAEVVPDSGNARKIELDFLAAAEPLETEGPAILQMNCEGSSVPEKSAVEDRTAKRAA